MSKHTEVKPTPATPTSQRSLVVNGVIVTTVNGVFDHYTPTPARIPRAQWQRIRPLVVTAVRAAGYPSIHATHFAMRATSGFVAHCEDQGLPLDPEVIFLPDRVEHYITTARAVATKLTRANERGALRRVGRAATLKAPWPPEPGSSIGHIHVTAPYTAEDVAGFRAIATQQATAHRTRVLTTLLVLGLGAGLKPREILACTADQVRQHVTHKDLYVIETPGRYVPVLPDYVDDLLVLRGQHPSGPLVGRYTPTAKDPFGVLRKGIEIPRHLPRLSVPRLRTTWMATVLAHDLRIWEFLHIAGLQSASSLDAIASYVPARWDDSVYLLKGAGLR